MPDILGLPAPVLIRAVLRAYGWKQQDLAERMGRAEVTITSWVHGRTEPRLSEAQALRKMLEEAPSPLDAALAEAGESPE